MYICISMRDTTFFLKVVSRTHPSMYESSEGMGKTSDGGRRRRVCEDGCGRLYGLVGSNMPLCNEWQGSESKQNVFLLIFFWKNHEERVSS